MKLIELLVKELPRRGGWPEEAKIMSQDAAGMINAHRNERLVFLIDQFWTGTSKNDACKNFSPFYLKKATDWNTNTVTREQYEAALTASKAVVGHDGWIKWAGGECPVDSDAIVEVKCRWHNQHQYNNDRAGDFYWAHTGSNADIIAYRLQQPGIDTRINDDQLEQDLNECIGQDIDIPEWNGEGLPPVGVEVEYMKYKRGHNDDWFIGAINYISDFTVVISQKGHKGEIVGHPVSFQFRPLRTEAEKAREKLAASLHIAAGASPIELNGIGSLYFKLADAIISGSVFGTTFKAGK